MTMPFASLKKDLPAGFIVFLVAMPLCLGVALASGAPLFSGIIAGIIGGIVVGALSGSAVGVSGPAAGLVAVVLSAIHTLDGFDGFLTALILAGAMQIVLAALKAGVVAHYFPVAVIKGMLTGIGLIIVVKQLPLLVGFTGSKVSDFSMDQLSNSVMILAALSFITMLLWQSKFIQRAAIGRVIQTPLIMVLLGIAYHCVTRDTSLPLRAEQLVAIPVLNAVDDLSGLFTFPDFSVWQNPQLYVIAATLAIVASIETLLCVEAADKLDKQQRVTPVNRELFAQGVGNMLAGFIGGLPITQVIVRSSANIQSGGRTKLSTIIHGILLLLSVLLIPNLLNMIPYVSLAIILITIGYQLSEPAVFAAMYRKGMNQFIPFMVTAIGIVGFDMLMGVAMGLVAAFGLKVWQHKSLRWS